MTDQVIPTDDESAALDYVAHILKQRRRVASLRPRPSTVPKQLGR
jgi:hypothetical protein